MLATVDPEQLKKLGKNMVQAGIPISMVVMVMVMVVMVMVVVLHTPTKQNPSTKCVIDYFLFEKNIQQGIIGV